MVRKPQGYRQTAAEACFCLLMVCLPYWQSLLFAGISGTLSLLLLTCLLMFVVMRSPEIYRTITACLKASPLSWVPPVFDCSVLWVSMPLRVIAQSVSLAPSFQRPPPVFS